MNKPIQPIQFIDLKTQRDRVRAGVEEGWRRVLDHGVYIMGPEIGQLEQELAAFCGAREVISCGSGTEAIWLPMLALGIGPGDAVFLPSWTFTATAEAVCLVGASPVFVDVDPETFNLDPASLKRAVAEVKRDGRLKPKSIIPVDIFGMVADYDAINAIAGDSGLTVVSDAAQSFGATWHNRKVGALATVTGTSFFPAKPLGCWGDGGAIFTDDPEIAEVLRSIRIHGRGSQGKYDNVRVGTNARLDTLQAVVLIEKLKIFEEELALRQQVADRYALGLRDVVHVPVVSANTRSAWAQYTIRCDRRDMLAEGLKQRGVPTQIYYPKPLHMQAPYARFPVAPGGLPVTERLKDEVLSLPMHPYLSVEHCDYVSASIREVLG